MSFFNEIRGFKIWLIDRKGFNYRLFTVLLIFAALGFFDYWNLWPDKHYPELLADRSIIKESGDLMLYLTLLAVIFYGVEAYRLRDHTYELVNDAEKRTALEQLPFLRLQWSDKTRQEIVNYVGKDNLDISTSLTLVNDGRGVARNVGIRPINIAGSVVYLKKVTAMKGDHGFTQLRYMENSPRLLEQETYDHHFIVVVDYEDYQGNARTTEFHLDSRYNDGFRIS